jgi:Protein of unknown function (DUF1488)
MIYSGRGNLRWPSPRSAVKCEISREALDDHFGTDGMDQTGPVEAVRKNRSKIETDCANQIPVLAGGGTSHGF